MVVEDAEAAAQACAERLADAVRAGGNVVLTGGSTPRRAYELAAALEPDWSAAHVWWGDERCVPPDDERSNYRLAKEALLDRLERGPAVVHRIEAERGADVAATAYEAELEGRTLDLLLLGVGPDGHTASLFPHAPGLEQRQRLVVPAQPGLEPFVERVTLTPAAIGGASAVLFLVTGAEKAEAAARAFEGPPDPGTPASLVRSRAGENAAILDRVAASRLDA